MGLSNLFKSNENEQLRKQIEDLKLKLSPEQQNIISLQAEIQNLENTKKELESKISSLAVQVNTLYQNIMDYKSQIVELENECALQEVSLYKPMFNFISSSEYKQRLEFIRKQEKAMIDNFTFVTFPSYFTLDGNVQKGKKLLHDTAKLIIKCFNSECDELVEKVKFTNFDKSLERMRKVFNDINRLVKSFEIVLNVTYLRLKEQELHLAYEYAQKKEMEKEELRQSKAELREQQKLELEIKQAREKINKERKHFNNAITELENKLKNCDESQSKDIINKIEEIKELLLQLDSEEKSIDYREQNAKAGYVYVISNIGAFGEGVYKIGMTRRLEPMDRIDELGDASVPFKFDVHALIFSENAPELEAKLHQHFSSCRLNKLNNRKEFFRADIDEIERVIKENYDKVLNITKVPEAQQYRESLLL